MVKELQPRAIQESRLPIPNFNLFCAALYSEGLCYDGLPREIIEKVGVHTSILLHDYDNRGGRWASIHYREGLDTLADNKTQIAWGKAFLRNLGSDLHNLSVRLTEDLTAVDTIYGLSQVSAKWGGNHGFVTQTFSDDPEVIRRHIQSIRGMPPQTNSKAPLTLFAIDRDVFLQHFHRVSETPVADLVGN